MKTKKKHNRKVRERAEFALARESQWLAFLLRLAVVAGLVFLLYHDKSVTGLADIVGNIPWLHGLKHLDK
ncbi:MAG: hypothetical protein JWQ71_3728 [Pedosphaera sp.]|nr:hypothetical protein [Pedosphaera sp.]